MGTFGGFKFTARDYAFEDKALDELERQGLIEDIEPSPSCPESFSEVERVSSEDKATVGQWLSSEK